MTSDALASLDALSRALVANRWPAISEWWIDTLTRFMTSRRRQLVIRAGRRAGKSSTLCRFAVAFALAYDVTKIPPGDVGIVGFVSVTRDEAAQRLRTIRAILDVLGVEYRPIDGGIELVGRPIVFRTFAATIGSVVGGTWILAICDEVARWRDSDTGSNPATEVLASIRPSLATQPDARIFLSSSPWSVEDAHATAFADGDDDYQAVAHAPTWVANPTVTEEDTRALERDPKVWAREYAAEPQQSLSAAFDFADVARALRPIGAITSSPAPLLLIDSSAGAGDCYCWGIAQRFTDEDGRSRIRVGHLGAFEGKFRKTLTSEQAIETIAKLARVKVPSISRAVGDGYADYFQIPIFAKSGISYTTVGWSNESKVAAVGRVRQWLRDGDLVVEPGPHGDRWRAEMLAFRERLTPTGYTTFGARNGTHDDHVALVIDLALADLAGLLPSEGTTFAPPPPVFMGDNGAGFDQFKPPSTFVTAGPGKVRSIDQIVEDELRGAARANADDERDAAPVYGASFVRHNPLEGF